MKFTTFSVVFYRESFLKTLFTFSKPAAIAAASPLRRGSSTCSSRACKAYYHDESLFKTETFLNFLK